MEILGIIVAAIVIYALFQAFRTKKDLDDPLFELKVEKLIAEYAVKHGEPPPGHLMPEIYKQARKEMKEQGLK